MDFDKVWLYIRNYCHQTEEDKTLLIGTLEDKSPFSIMFTRQGKS